MWDSMLTSLCRAEWSNFHSSPRLACFRHADQIHKLLRHRSSDMRSGRRCRSGCPGNSGSHVLWADSSACRSPGATSPPCGWRIQLQPDALVGWECPGPGREADVVEWLNAGVQCEFGSFVKMWEKKECLTAVYSNIIMLDFTDGSGTIDVLQTFTVLQRCTVI